MWIELLCHLWSQFALVWLSVRESLSFSQQTTLLKKLSQTPVDRWHVSSHTKREAESLSTGPPQSESEKPPSPLIDRRWVFHAHALVRRVASSHVKTICLKRIVADRTLAWSPHTGTLKSSEHFISGNIELGSWKTENSTSHIVAHSMWLLNKIIDYICLE